MSPKAVVKGPRLPASPPSLTNLVRRSVRAAFPLSSLTDRVPGTGYFLPLEGLRALSPTQESATRLFNASLLLMTTR